MKKYYNSIKASSLLEGINENEWESLSGCLSAAHRRYKKNSFIFPAGETAVLAGIVVSGKVHVVRDDFWGRRLILAHIPPGELFGEAFACSGDKTHVSAVAAEESEILLIDCAKVVSACSNFCAFHMKAMKNLIRILAGKNVRLTRKMEHITRRTTRERLLSYFSEMAAKTGKNVFEIPFNRQELADYLSVDRSAMSNELCKMRDEGMLNFHKNRFKITEDPAICAKLP